MRPISRSRPVTRRRSEPKTISDMGVVNFDFESKRLASEGACWCQEKYAISDSESSILFGAEEGLMVSLERAAGKSG